MAHPAPSPAEREEEEEQPGLQPGHGQPQRVLGVTEQTLVSKYHPSVCSLYYPLPSGTILDY